MSAGRLVKPVAITLMGPTASGKTALALELARQMDVSLISVDSTMVYQGLNIGSAKPDAETLEAFPHALVDIRQPEDNFSVREFCEAASDAVEDAFKTNKLPLLVGGSMMYFRAFRSGLAELPDADQSIRADIRALAEERGLGAVHEALAHVDPVAAAAISPRNLKRMERALEVFRITGSPITELWGKQATQNAESRLGCHLLEFAMPKVQRAELHQRIEARLKDMFAAGLIEEVRALRERPRLHANSLSMRTVGYREIWHYLENEQAESQTKLFESILVATRRLARKQMTWLRSWPKEKLAVAESVSTIVKRVTSLLD